MSGQGDRNKISGVDYFAVVFFLSDTILGSCATVRGVWLALNYYLQQREREESCEATLLMDVFSDETFLHSAAYPSCFSK
jgi:hypothetical protein